MWIPVLFSLFSLTAGFNKVVKDNVIIRGSTSPLPDFDPLQFSKNKDVAYLREAELKHARWGMIGATSVPLLETITHRPAIHEFQALSTTDQLLITGFIGAVEFQTMLRGWRMPWNAPFELNDTYQPGDVGLGLLKEKSSEGAGVLMDKELNNGRLAMIAFMGMLVQELVTKQPLL
jgi:light-harvesting complex I chlorophyll a/b binding protein 1